MRLYLPSKNPIIFQTGGQTSGQLIRIYYLRRFQNFATEDVILFAQRFLSQEYVNTISTLRKLKFVGIFNDDLLTFSYEALMREHSRSTLESKGKRFSEATPVVSFEATPGGCFSHRF